MSTGGFCCGNCYLRRRRNPPQSKRVHRRLSSPRLHLLLPHRPPCLRPRPKPHNIAREALIHRRSERGLHLPSPHRHPCLLRRCPLLRRPLEIPTSKAAADGAGGKGHNIHQPKKLGFANRSSRCKRSSKCPLTLASPPPALAGSRGSACARRSAPVTHSAANNAEGVRATLLSPKPWKTAPPLKAAGAPRGSDRPAPPSGHASRLCTFAS